MGIPPHRQSKSSLIESATVMRNGYPRKNIEEESKPYFSISF
jgi:hypothetical protein